MGEEGPEQDINHDDRAHPGDLPFAFGGNNAQHLIPIHGCPALQTAGHLIEAHGGKRREKRKGEREGKGPEHRARAKEDKSESDEHIDRRKEQAKHGGAAKILPAGRQGRT